MKLVWTRLAIIDINNARNYIAEENPRAAEDIIQRIEKATQALGRHPMIGRPGRVQNTRELVIPGTPFIIPYRIRNQRVEVLAVIHGARRWPESI